MQCKIDDLPINCRATVSVTAFLREDNRSVTSPALHLEPWHLLRPVISTKFRSAHSIHVHWQPLVIDKAFAIVVGYTVEVRDPKSEACIQSHRVESVTREITIDQLEKEKEYAIQVCAQVADGPDLPAEFCQSNALKVSTASAPSKPVVYVSSKSMSCISLFWLPVSFYEEIEGYRLIINNNLFALLGSRDVSVTLTALQLSRLLRASFDATMMQTLSIVLEAVTKDPTVVSRSDVIHLRCFDPLEPLLEATLDLRIGLSKSVHISL
jgi:hypothetical protein